MYALTTALNAADCFAKAALDLSSQEVRSQGDMIIDGFVFI